jgi:uncharacterized OsmC-like protein
MANDIYEAHFYDVRYRAVMDPQQQVKVFTDRNSFNISKIVNFDNECSNISSSDYFGGAIISSLLSALAAQCQRHRTTLEEAEGTAQLQLANPLTLVGVKGLDDKPYFSRITLTIYALLVPEPEDFQAFCQQALLLCPIYQTLSRSTPIDVSFKQLL